MSTNFVIVFRSLLSMTGNDDAVAVVARHVETRREIARDDGRSAQTGDAIQRSDVPAPVCYTTETATQPSSAISWLPGRRQTNDDAIFVRAADETATTTRRRPFTTVQQSAAEGGHDHP